MGLLLRFFWLLGVFFVIHVLVWRKMPSWQSKKHLLWIGGAVYLISLPGFPGFWPGLQVSLAYWSAVLSYVIFYLWIESESPSLLLIEQLALASNKTRSKAELLQHWASQLDPVEPRLKALVVDGFCEEVEGRYALTPRGEQLAALFAFLAHYYEMEEGG